MKLKGEALLAMVALLLLGLWLVWGPFKNEGLPAQRPDSHLVDINFAGTRGALEIAPDHTYRLLFRDGSGTEIMSRTDITRLIPDSVITAAEQQAGSRAFRILNITSWASVIWVSIGLAGQIAFFGRMAIQWVISEGRRESVVPASFWYLSFIGGVMLFAYFAWRRDIVGVLGQTTGVVIYARNIRLIRKAHRRALRDEERRLRREQRQAEETTAVSPPTDTPE
ncbi:MAG: lipid-A-disaccharide synthase N-terminal domain-containing protein [Phycisphaerales bacterium]|nr:lipid-A-disaccharide synthase N-terminal domain-containing protein [Phycisphaerales bacterium]